MMSIHRISCVERDRITVALLFVSTFITLLNCIIDFIEYYRFSQQLCLRGKIGIAVYDTWYILSARDTSYRKYRRLLHRND